MYCAHCGTENNDHEVWCRECGAEMPRYTDGGSSADLGRGRYGAREPAGYDLLTSEERTLGMLCHLLGLVGFVGPLVLWLVKRNESAFVDDQGKEALNFQLSLLIYGLLCGVSVFFVVGILLLPVLMVFSIVAVILAAMKANDGSFYRYPLCIRFIR
jgi:uncharacterized Tic20 family protein